MIFTADLMRSTKTIFIGDVYVAVALRGLIVAQHGHQLHPNMTLNCLNLVFNCGPTWPSMYCGVTPLCILVKLTIYSGSILPCIRVQLGHVLWTSLATCCGPAWPYIVTRLCHVFRPHIGYVHRASIFCLQNLYISKPNLSMYLKGLCHQFRTG
jgi:hypothetical protein